MLVIGIVIIGACMGFKYGCFNVYGEACEYGLGFLGAIAGGLLGLLIGILVSSITFGATFSSFGEKYVTQTQELLPYKCEGYEVYVSLNKDDSDKLKYCVSFKDDEVLTFNYFSENNTTISYCEEGETPTFTETQWRFKEGSFLDFLVGEWYDSTSNYDIRVPKDNALMISNSSIKES